MFCNNCGNKLSESDKFCTACGQRVLDTPPVRYADDGRMHCVSCGYQILEDEEVCGNCGCPTEVTVNSLNSRGCAPKPKLTLHIWSIICSLFLSVVIGGVLAIIATVKAIKSGNKTLKRWSIASIIICVIGCVLNILLSSLLYDFLMAMLA
ncbi:MAG: zinc ribbon domain-containing protein [Clostridia bacterium]|nr:zinc ribbon domain-containing protein [Clostridia bacterium]